MPLTLIASSFEGQRNVATHGQVMTVSQQPAAMGLSVMKAHRTADLIARSGVFSVNLPSAPMLREVMLCGGMGGAVDKAALFRFADSDRGILLISDCPLSIACRVTAQVDAGDSTLFVGRVEEVWADDACLEGDALSVASLSAMVCSMDGCFYCPTQPLPVPNLTGGAT